MFLSEAQAKSRLSSEKNLANRFGKQEEVSNKEVIVVSPEELKPERAINPENTVVERQIKLAGKRRKNLKESTRSEIALRARTGEVQDNLAKEYGITQANVSHISNGKTKGIDEESVNKKIGEVKDLALDRLMTSLGLLTPDKLSGCSAKDLSVIAGNMGKVVEQTSPKEDKPDGLTFIIYAPELKNEKAYKTIEV